MHVDGKWTKKEGLTAEEVNRANSCGGMFGDFNHDAINRFILIETRAKRLGVYGHCQDCKGDGYIYTEPAAHVNLILWMIHPRKGCSRGIEVSNIQESDIPAITKYLKEAAKRNADRFSSITKTKRSK